MGGPGNPSEGTPEGFPGGGDDEFRSVVFDESFIRAARIQEYSANERLGGTTEPVHTRPPSVGGASRQIIVLLVLVALAFGTAIYMGIRHPYQEAEPPATQSLRITMTPLVPRDDVPVVDHGAPYRGHLAESYPVGADGIVVPPSHRSGGFSEGEVLQALTTAKEYLVASSLVPEALTGGDVRDVRNFLDSGQLEQFDRSLERSAADGWHSAIGWLVRFDPARVRLADDDVRVQGVLNVVGAADGVLEIAADHTLVYAIRGTGPGQVETSLFTVRRELRLHFDRADLRDRHVQVVQAAVQAGPLSCAAESAAYFSPMLAGDSPGTPPGTDPYDRELPAGSACGILAADPVVSPSAVVSSLPPPQDRTPGSDR